MGCASSRMEIAWIETGRLKPNRWNPNRISADKYAKLHQEIEARGFCGAVVARPAAEGDGFEIVDGEHRWRIAGELGLAQVPCVVLDLAERDAKVKTLQMNGLRGENDPARLAALIAELAGELGIPALEALVPYNAEELSQLAALAAEGEEELRRRAGSAARALPPAEELWAVVVSRAEREDIARAVARARRDEGFAEDGPALAAVCRRYAA